jgi:hypothetical protein
MEIELIGGPADGRRMRIQLHTPYLRIPMDLGIQPIDYRPGPIAPAPIPVANYVRCDHVNGRVSYRYAGQELMS